MKRKLFKCTANGPKYEDGSIIGLYEQMHLTKDELSEKIALHMPDENWIKNYKWEDEEGNKYSSWKICTGSICINTGDAGMRLIEEAIKKQGFKYGK